MRTLLTLFFVFLNGHVHASATDNVMIDARKENFSFVDVKDKTELREYLSAYEIRATDKILEQNDCTTDNVGLYFKRGYRVRVITVDCPKPFIEYPFVIVVSAGSIMSIDFEGFGFMYQSGIIRAVTDMDSNGYPEFWLTGSTCECDDPEGEHGECDCEGKVVVEARSGKLTKWRK